MKKLFTSIAVLFICSAAFCQYDTIAPYLKTKTLPNFSLLNADSTLFTQSVLKSNKHTVVMLYNPECGHCQEQLKMLIALPQMKDSLQIVLTSTQPLFRIKQFYKKFKLHQYKSIFSGKDYSWSLGKYYQPKTIPVLAIYNKQNKMSFFSQGNATKEQLLDALKK